MNLADSIREPGGPTSLDFKAIPDGTLLKRDGSSVVGVDPGTITTEFAEGLVETGGPTELTMGAVADTEILTRSGTTIDGVLPSAMTVGVATYANGVRETSGPTTLAMGAVADNEVLTRSGATIDGIATSAMTVGLATLAGGLRYSIGPVDLTMGVTADGDDLTRSGTTILGVPRNTVTLAPDATYNWNSTAMYLAVTHAAAACDVTLPDETQLANWPVGQTRRLVKLNTSAFGINLIAPANIVVNGAAAGTDASPVTGSLLVPAIAVNCPHWLVYRASATAFWIQGWAS